MRGKGFYNFLAVFWCSFGWVLWDILVKHCKSLLLTFQISASASGLVGFAGILSVSICGSRLFSPVPHLRAAVLRSLCALLWSVLPQPLQGAWMWPDWAGSECIFPALSINTSNRWLLLQYSSFFFPTRWVTLSFVSSMSWIALLRECCTLIPWASMDTRSVTILRTPRMLRGARSSHSTWRIPIPSFWWTLAQGSAFWLPIPKTTING